MFECKIKMQFLGSFTSELKDGGVLIKTDFYLAEKGFVDSFYFSGSNERAVAMVKSLEPLREYELTVRFDRQDKGWKHRLVAIE